MTGRLSKKGLIVMRLRRGWFSVIFLMGCPEGLSTNPGNPPGPAGPTETCVGLDVPMRGAGAELVPPAGIRVAFSVERCADRTPVPDLTLGRGIEVINNETGEPFGSEGLAVPEIEINDQINAYVILVLDMSFSITNTLGRRDAVINGARSLIQSLLRDDLSPSLRPFIAIYAFGSTADSRLEIDFTRNRDRLNKVLNALAMDPGRGSTNLYGAFMESLARLEIAGQGLSDNAIVSRTLVILTDGVHETGDADELRRDAIQALTQAQQANDVQSFAMPIQDSSDEFDIDAVCDLATSRNDCFIADQMNSIEMRFGEIVQFLDARSRSNYLLGVCSPVEGADRKLTIEVTEEALNGQLEVDYDATNFQLTNCDPRLVVSCNDGREATEDCDGNPDNGCETSVGALAEHDDNFDGERVRPSFTSNLGSVAQEVVMDPGNIAIERVVVRMQSPVPSVSVAVRVHPSDADGRPGPALGLAVVTQATGDCSPAEITLNPPFIIDSRRQSDTDRVFVSVEWELANLNTGVCADEDAPLRTPQPIYESVSPDLGPWTELNRTNGAWLGLDLFASCAP